MSNWRRVFVPGGTYCFTLVTENWAPILADPIGRSILRHVLRDCQRTWPFEILAIVLLPNHLHTLWRMPEGDDAYSRRLGWIKKEFTKGWIAGGWLLNARALRSAFRARVDPRNRGRAFGFRLALGPERRSAEPGRQGAGLDSPRKARAAASGRRGRSRVPWADWNRLRESPAAYANPISCAANEQPRARFRVKVSASVSPAREGPGHESGVFLTDAEPEPADDRQVGDVILDLMQYRLCPDLVGAEHLVDVGLHVVAAVPIKMSETDRRVIGDPERVKRGEVLLEAKPISWLTT